MNVTLEIITTALAFHAEKLHDDAVWTRVERVSSLMARKAIKATFFVYPFRAQVAGKDVADRVRFLSAAGHEIAQHTHFYDGIRIDKPNKSNDLSATNIARCLYRDFETLEKAGVSPKGFTAGAWLVNEVVLDTLVALGFSYDCSAQLPKRQGSPQPPYARWLSSPQLYTKKDGAILCLPTTCSLGEWFKSGRRLTAGGTVRYQLIYLHDYDLLALRNRVLLSCFLKLRHRQILKPLDTLAKECLFQRGEV